MRRGAAEDTERHPRRLALENSAFEEAGLINGGVSFLGRPVGPAGGRADKTDDFQAGDRGSREKNSLRIGASIRGCEEEATGMDERIVIVGKAFHDVFIGETQAHPQPAGAWSAGEGLAQ